MMHGAWRERENFLIFPPFLCYLRPFKQGEALSATETKTRRKTKKNSQKKGAYKMNPSKEVMHAIQSYFVRKYGSGTGDVLADNFINHFDLNYPDQARTSPELYAAINNAMEKER